MHVNERRTLLVSVPVRVSKLKGLITPLAILSFWLIAPNGYAQQFSDERCASIKKEYERSSRSSAKYLAQAIVIGEEKDHYKEQIKLLTWQLKNLQCSSSDQTDELYNKCKPIVAKRLALIPVYERMKQRRIELLEAFETQETINSNNRGWMRGCRRDCKQSHWVGDWKTTYNTQGNMILRAKGKDKVGGTYNGKNIINGQLLNHGCMLVGEWKHASGTRKGEFCFALVFGKPKREFAGSWREGKTYSRISRSCGSGTGWTGKKLD